jgi:hypothetical protein
MVVKENNLAPVAALLQLPCAFCFCFKSGASEFTIPSDAAWQLDSEQAFLVELIAQEKHQIPRLPTP